MGSTGTMMRTHHHHKEGVHMMNVTRIGIDLAKHVFQLHGVDDRGHTVLRRRVSRTQLRPFFVQLRRCLIGVEACGGAHYWARELTTLGHDVRLIAPQFVAPYRKNDKNDGHDAEAICEAVGRPHMRFVPVKDVGQQAVLVVYRARQLLIAERTALVNQTRGLLAEYGLIVPAGIGALRRALPGLLETPELPALAHEVFTDLADRLRAVDERIAAYDRRVAQLARQTEPAQRLMQVSGVGPVTATPLFQERCRAG
jgi:transposase